MTKKRIQRKVRQRRLTPEEGERDRALRKRLQEEFPPAPAPAMPHGLSDMLRTAIRQSEMSLYQIARKASVSQIIISRFLAGERDIRMATADKLAHALGLMLAPADCPPRAEG